MATLTVWKFDSPTGAEDAVVTLESLAKQELIKVHDAATVSWPADKKKPKTRQLNNLAGAGALGGAFWGLLFGILFFIPLIGLAVGAAAGALAGSLTDVGIDDDFIRGVREQITPGTSALFVMTSDAVLDKVEEAFKGTHAQLLRTNLSNEQEAKLREAFADD
jgi:uncharacterized membrane protein